MKKVVRKNIRKFVLAIMAVVMMVSMAVPAFAVSDEKDKNTEVDVTNIFSLSDQDLLDLNRRILEFSKKNKTEEEIDAYLLTILGDYECMPGTRASDLKPNEAEKALVLKYPTQAAAYWMISRESVSLAEARYTQGSCWWSGNGDAFRHTYWNAALMRRYYELFTWDVNKCASVTKMWTDAHEEDGEPWSIHHDMDILNNYAGRNIGYEYYDSSYAEILQETQRYIDNGYCHRVDRRAGDTEDKLYPTDTTEKL